MTRLSVNINKIATLRNARGGNKPDLVEAAVRIQEYGAEGITIHPRPDERHIRYADVYALKEVVTTEFNIEGYPNADFLRLVHDVCPDQVTLVPDPPGVLTSNAGWDAQAHEAMLTEVVTDLKRAGMRVSLFLDPMPERVEAAAKTGADRIELYTEAYARGYLGDRAEAIEPYKATAEAALKAGLGVNAGHDLDLDNLTYFCREIPELLEVSIGHALISDALYFGLENVVHMYLRKIELSQTP